MFQPQPQQQQPFFKLPQSQQPHYQPQQQQPFFRPPHSVQQGFQPIQQDTKPSLGYRNDEEFEELKRHFRDAAQTDNGYVVRFRLSQSPSDCFTLFINYMTRNLSFENAPTVQVYPKGRVCRILDSESRLCCYNLLENWASLARNNFRAAHFAYSIYRFFEDNPPAMSPTEAELKQMEEAHPELAKISDAELSAVVENPQKAKSLAHTVFGSKGEEDEVSKLSSSISSTVRAIESELVPEARKAEAEIEAKRAEYTRLQGEYMEALEKCSGLCGSVDLEGTREKLNAALGDVDRELRDLKAAGPGGDLNAYVEKYKALNMSYYRIKLVLESLK